VRKKVPALLLFAALAISPANALTPVPRQQTSPIVPGARTGHNEAFAHEITQLFNEDQAMISDLESARKNPAFEQTYQSYAHHVEVELNDPNFFFAALFELWAQEPGAPDIVRRYVTFHKYTDTRIESIITQYGWPQRASVDGASIRSPFGRKRVSPPALFVRELECLLDALYLCEDRRLVNVSLFWQNPDHCVVPAAKNLIEQIRR
jgi:hypothetical protein